VARERLEAFIRGDDNATFTGQEMPEASVAQPAVEAAPLEQEAMAIA
jgi:hypothetical protein